MPCPPMKAILSKAVKTFLALENGPRRTDNLSGLQSADLNKTTEKVDEHSIEAHDFSTVVWGPPLKYSKAFTR